MRNPLWLDAGFAKRNKIFGKFLPRITAATGSKRRALLCKLAADVTDAHAQERIPLVKSAEQFPSFRNDFWLIVSAYLMPVLKVVDVDEESLKAMNATVASRANYWVGEMAIQLRGNSAAPDSAAVATDTTSKPSSAKDIEAGRRRAQVDAYIERESSRTGKTITRTAIWEKLHYKSHTEFERWQRNDRRATKTAHERFTRLLTGGESLK
jgi:hypothetical protein